MKNLIYSMALIVGIMSQGGVSVAEGYDLKKLDILGTCNTPEKQQNGMLGLSFLQEFTGWHMKEQLDMIHPEYISWHSSLAGLLESRPELRDRVPFKNGQWQADNYLEVMAFLAFHNDITQYKTVPTRVDCVGNDEVVLISQFNGLQIRRDEKGCVTHGVAFGSPTKIQIIFKDYQRNEDAPKRRLAYRTYSNLDDQVSHKVREELAKVAQGPANIPFNPGSCKTYSQILEEFRKDAEQ